MITNFQDIKKRIERELSKKSDDTTNENEAGSNATELEDELVQNDLLFDLEDSVNSTEKNPKLGEHWLVKNGGNSLFAIIVDENPLGVKYFQSTIRGNFRLDDKVYDVFIDDLERQIEKPEVKAGKTRTFYHFKNFS